MEKRTELETVCNHYARISLYKSKYKLLPVGSAARALAAVIVVAVVVIVDVLLLDLLLHLDLAARSGDRRR